MGDKPRIFIDTSVLISAVFSSKGGSSIILDFARNKIIDIVITDSVTLEARYKLKNKYSLGELNKLNQHIDLLQSFIKPSVPGQSYPLYTKLITDPKDRHIIAGAIKYKVDYLVTLDRKHFFTDKLLKADLGFKIRTPQTFLNEFRNSRQIS